MKGRNILIKTLTLGISALALASCGRLDGTYYSDNRIFANVDLASKYGIKFEDTSYSDKRIIRSDDAEANYDISYETNKYKMRVYEELYVYEKIGDPKPVDILSDGTVVRVEELDDSEWILISDETGSTLGYAKDGFMHIIPDGTAVYAELPIEYGVAKDYGDKFYDAYSHLVDIRRYFRCYESTEGAEGVNWDDYDLWISMKLSTYDTSIKEPFYYRNLCMVQYDILPMLKKAVDIFKAEGYTIKIYDSYRPTSVQQRWFDVIKVHKWVADPSIGLGGVHDRGTAVDMSLVDRDGNEIEFATPMHTFTEESARSSTKMSKTARKNMDYMTDIMVGCGFTYIESEWWHFQDVNTRNYLPTDHKIDEIPLVVSER